MTLDLTALENQLKSTKAIGIFSKIALKNQVDDLMKQFREHYQGKSSTTMTELRQSYDLLIMKVLSLVQKRRQNSRCCNRVFASGDMGFARGPEEICRARCLRHWRTYE